MYTKETSFSRRMKQAEQHAASLLQQILIFVLIFLVIFMMVQIQNLHGTAHVVNYAGLVRGATQREVKLEITGTADDMQIEYLDKILSGLKYEDGNYNLVSLKDSAYQQCLDNQIEYWELLKEEIYTVREKGYENTNVVSMSETYFEYADETVTAAEQYSEKIAARIRLTEIISALDILLLIFLIVQQQIQHIILSADSAVTNLSLFCMTPPPGRQTNYWKNYMLRSNSIIPAICRMRSVTPMVTATP